MNSELQALLKKIVAVYHPQRIYLFGSHARGAATDESDYDLLVELVDSDLAPYVRPVEGYKAIFETGLAVDLLVYTTAEINERKNKATHLIAKILEQGNLLYERS